MIIWLVVLTILKNISQWEGLSGNDVIMTGWSIPTPLKNMKVSWDDEIPN